MLLHEFRPGRLIVGLTALAVSAAYVGDAADAGPTPWFVAFPMMFWGLFLAAVVTWCHYRIRRRRSARTASRENEGAPASTSGSQAMR
ncbi:hypothetical protein ACIQ7D_28500 [Streptomyces sp. NPDC096310]|uniref:hypothetical protein n=1 Tax=Streptomyces sp. NPDC096310 TaxID=3366082 RepID=UPI00380BD037